MSLQNRVRPDGEIVADAACGEMMGNRGGALHGTDRTLGKRRWVSRQWICCRLQFNGRHREIMAPGRYTELFVLDEATALAAGHRPCFECRRADATSFARHWSAARGLDVAAAAAEIDRELHAERLDQTNGAKRLHALDIADLPAGAIFRDQISGEPRLVLADCIRPWTANGYGARIQRPRGGKVAALTPSSTIAALNSGYLPLMHVSARDPG